MSMKKLPYDKARDNAKEAIDNYLVDIEIWDGNKRKLCVDFLYPRSKDKINEKEIVAETEADARAKMLIYLKENNLI